MERKTFKNHSRFYPTNSFLQGTTRSKIFSYDYIFHFIFFSLMIYYVCIHNITCMKKYSSFILWLLLSLLLVPYTQGKMCVDIFFLFLHLSTDFQGKTSKRLVSHFFNIMRKKEKHPKEIPYFIVFWLENFLAWKNFD